LTPEASGYLEKARQCLGYAKVNLGVGLGNDAGRNAYLAAFHAAQGFIFERTGKVAKSHNGVHTEFNRVAKTEEGLDLEIRRFLPQAYNLKAVADYEMGPESEVPLDRAASAIKKRRAIRQLHRGTPPERHLGISDYLKRVRSLSISAAGTLFLSSPLFSPRWAITTPGKIASETVFSSW
jgi:uncharacterized protein (UPF0332 family)